MPALLLGLGIAGVVPCAAVGGMILTACAFLILLIWLRAYFPGKLPHFLSQNPAWLHPPAQVEVLLLTAFSAAYCLKEYSTGINQSFFLLM